MRHSYVIGASGTGKSHFLLNLIIQDVESGQGIAVLDPHGDLVDQVLGYIPEERHPNVVLLDPGDEHYSTGFNILSAHSELEKNLLASDLVAVFERLSRGWGDRMTSVLGNAVLAFLESSRGGTLADLRRFLVEPVYRKDFLSTVTDSEVVYYWEKEFPLLSGKPQGPVLTRLDTFLRPRFIRHMVGQQENRLDFADIMNGGKIFLAKLAQGAIGEENAELLGTLLVSKFHQLAIARQAMAARDRKPFWVYIDEFHNFVTPSMEQILSGARKYGLGLTLAHQDLQQLTRRSADVASAVLTNPATRVCFRVGDQDARRLADGFSSFDTKDLQNLGVGEAVCRIERADWDFNLKTLPRAELDQETAALRRQKLIDQSRLRYGTRREEVEAALAASRGTSQAPQSPVTAPHASESPGPPPIPPRPTGTPQSLAEGLIGAQAQPTAPPPAPVAGKGGPEHIYNQELIRRWAQDKGYLATVEAEILDGLGSVDIALEKDGWRLACEVSVTTTPEHELRNVQKCLSAGFDVVAVVSTHPKALAKLEEHITERLERNYADQVLFVTPPELFALLSDREAEAAGGVSTVRGYTVKRRYKALDSDEEKARRGALSKILGKSIKKLKRTDE